MSTVSDKDLRELAKFVAEMATTGEGTDYCLEAGALPLPVHFYSPVPDIKDLDARNVWDKKSALRGVDMRPAAQLKLAQELGARFGLECNWPENPTDNPVDFHWKNNSFSFQCASLLYSMIRYYQPRRVIEVGSGFSSRVISTALKKNESLGGAKAEYQVIDPYPNDLINKLPAITKVYPNRVEEIDVGFFSSLGENDLLFVDSGHVVKIGADVNYMILDVLPTLAPGVVIHFHDIPMPKEYGRIYYTNPQFRMLWTESYLLQAFLAFNSEFEVLLGAVYMNLMFKEVYKTGFPLDPGVSTSASFWIRRKPTNK